MKNNVDVLSMQMRIDAKAVQKLKQTDYRKIEKPGIVARFLFECSIKLSMKPLTSAAAAIIFHRFFKDTQDHEYDDYLIAASSLFIAGKIKEDPVKIRDVINVAHTTLNRGAAPLDLCDEYWAMRDSIVQAELLILRTLNFDLDIEHPHKYLLYYQSILSDWLGTVVWNSAPLAKVSASFLQDYHHSPKILKHKPTHIAVCCLSLALQTYGIQVPLTDESDEASQWYSVFVQDMSKETHWEIMEDIMEVYKMEADIDGK